MNFFLASTQPITVTEGKRIKHRVRDVPQDLSERQYLADCEACEGDADWFGCMGERARDRMTTGVHQ